MVLRRMRSAACALGVLAMITLLGSAPPTASPARAGAAEQCESPDEDPEFPHLDGMVFLLDPFPRGDQVLIRQRCAEIEVVTLAPTPWGHLPGTTIATGRMRYSRAIRAYEVNGRYRVGGVSADERDAWTDLRGIIGVDRPRGQTIIDLEATVWGRPLRLFGVER